MLAIVLPLYAQTHSLPALNTNNAWTGNETHAGNETFVDLTIAGPRPYIDVTAYGARGDGGGLSTTGSIQSGRNALTVASAAGWAVNNGLTIVGADATGNQLAAQITSISGNVLTLNVNAGTTVTGASVEDDDTYPISETINAACASTLGAFHSKPLVFFPPGVYSAAQPQGSSAASVLPSCPGLTMSGPAAGYAAIIVRKGSNPSAGPLMAVQLSNTFSNLEFAGYNQALFFENSGTNDASVDNFSNVWAFLVTSTPTGQIDNAAVKIGAAVIEVVWNGGEVSSLSNSVPNFIFTDDGTGNFPGILDFENIGFGNGPDVFSERATCGNAPGDFIFKNDIREDAIDSFLTFTATGRFSGGCVFNSITLDHVLDADNPTGTTALINFDNPNSYLSGVWIKYSNASSYSAIINTSSVASELENVHILAGQEGGAFAVVDANGKPIGESVNIDEQRGGVDHISGGIYQHPTAGAFQIPPQQALLADRWFKNGAGYATLALDGNFGQLFGDGTTAGFSSGFIETTPETVDVQFAKLLPPTAFKGSATTGGSLSAATYYAVVVTSTGSMCGNGPRSTFAYASGVAVSGSNKAVSYSWTLPAPAPLSGSITGYCIGIGTSPWATGAPLTSAIYVSGASTTSFTYAGQTQGSIQVWPTGSFQAEHRLTSNSLGINTTSPAYDLDVTHASAANSGIRATGANLTGLAESAPIVCTDGSKNLSNSCPAIPLAPTSVSTTSATSDDVPVTGMTSSGHCILQATNASAATNLAATYVSVKTTNQITVTHAGTSGMTYDVFCTAN